MLLPERLCHQCQSPLSATDNPGTEIGMRRAAEELLPLLDCFPHPAIVVRPDHEIVFENRAYRAVYAEARIGRKCFEASHHRDTPCDECGETCPMKLCVERGSAARVLHVHFTPHGPEHLDLEVWPICDAAGTPVLYTEVIRPVPTIGATPGPNRLIGRSPAFNESVGLVQRVAPSDIPVLLIGESGTGKELMARAIHDASHRASRPFVPVACSGFSASLFESELFGHERGAFTGAHARHQGLVELARKGTLFLDEVGDMPLSLQAKMLRLLESLTFRRVGGNQDILADFRLVCATNCDLARMVEEGGFRRDLYYRINGFPIRVPTLRERIEDVPLLARSFLAAAGSQKTLHPDTVALLQAHSFPGNVRELRNLVHYADLVADGDVLLPRHFPLEARGASATEVVVEDILGGEIVSLEELEHRYVAWADRRFGGSRAELAHLLGISERTLYRRIRGARGAS